MSKSLITSGEVSSAAVTLQLDEIADQLVTLVRSNAFSTLISEDTITQSNITKVDTFQAGNVSFATNVITVKDDPTLVIDAPNLQVKGNLTVNSTTTANSTAITLNTTTLRVLDPLVELNTNAADNALSDLGLLFYYIDENTNIKQGFIGYNSSTKSFQLIKDVVSPNLTSNTVDDLRNVLGKLDVGELKVTGSVVLANGRISHDSATNVSTVADVVFNPGAGSVTNPYRLVQNNNIACTGDLSVVNVHASSAVNAQTFETVSDARLKTDVQDVDVDEALRVLGQLQVKRYRYIDAATGRGAGKPKVGFIAQQVETLMPDAVHENAQGFKRLEQDSIHALTVAAVQKLSAQVERLTARVAAVERALKIDDGGL